MADMPIIRLEVDHMRHTLLTYLGKYYAEMQHYIETELTKQIAVFDFGSCIEKEVQYAIRQEIQNYFKYGDGAKIIREAALKAITEYHNRGENM